MATESTLTRNHIYKALSVMPYDRAGKCTIRPYRAFYLARNLLYQEGIEVSPQDVNRPVLLLAGTSLPLEDRIEFILAIATAGYEVASIENALGGLFDVTIDPVKERPDALRHFLGHLVEIAQVEDITILAQSYSAFEVIRVLLEDPARYRRHIRSILFINPPGLNENTGIVKHSTRFVGHHVLKGYLKARRKLKELSESGLAESMKKRSAEIDFYRTEINGINIWSKRTFVNPARTMRELYDVVSFRIRDYLATLQDEFGYDLNFFLQSDDQLLPVEISLQTLAGLVPSEKIRVVPGGHNDLFFQKWQRKALLDFIGEIRSRTGLNSISPHGSDSL